MRFLMAIGATPLIAFAVLVKAYDVSPLARMSPGTIAHRVAAVYGEKHPRIVKVYATVTDSTPHEKMYLIELTGRFRHRGKPTARYLSFSALADRTYIWGIVGDDRPHHLVWIDTTLPSRTR